MEKVVLIRMDKIGDLVLALPADQNPALSGKRVTWIINRGCGFVVKHAQAPREFIEVPKESAFRNYRQLVKVLKKLSPDLAVVLHAPWWVGLALWRAKVPRRFARRSQWHSWLFFNSGLRQSRKQGERHESDYNIELVSAALGSNETHSTPLKMLAPNYAVEQWGLKPKDYIVVHPGMAGSALNLSTQQWIDVVSEILKTDSVVVTGTKLDRGFTAPIFHALGAEKRVTWLNEKLTVEELLSVLASARAVVAPSTGVVHLAASLGTPVVGIYSPIPVQRPTRWGPKGSAVTTLVPDGTDEEIKTQPQALMERITTPMILDALKKSGALS